MPRTTRRFALPDRETASFELLVREVQALRDVLANSPRLHRKDLLSRFGISAATLYRRIERKRLPAPTYETGRPLWRLADLEAFERGGKPVR